MHDRYLYNQPDRQANKKQPGLSGAGVAEILPRCYPIRRAW
jgi:hypothetical protein